MSRNVVYRYAKDGSICPQQKTYTVHLPSSSLLLRRVKEGTVDDWSIKEGAVDEPRGTLTKEQS